MAAPKMMNKRPFCSIAVVDSVMVERYESSQSCIFT
jgi:hypothetical protein